MSANFIMIRKRVLGNVSRLAFRPGIMSTPTRMASKYVTTSTSWTWQPNTWLPGISEVQNRDLPVESGKPALILPFWS